MKIIKVIKIIVLLFLFTITLALGSKNYQMVTFDYMIAKSELSLSALLGFTFLFTFIIVAILFSSSYFKNKWKITRLSQKVTKLQAQLDAELAKNTSNNATNTIAPKSELVDNQIIKNDDKKHLEKMPSISTSDA